MVDVLFKKNEYEGFNMVSKHEKTDESTRPQTEGVYCFRVLMMTSVDFFHDETWCMSFLKQLLNRVSGIQENTNIHELFTRSRQVCCINIQIKKPVHQCLKLYFSQGFDIIRKSWIARYSSVLPGFQTTRMWRNWCDLVWWSPYE